MNDTDERMKLRWGQNRRLAFIDVRLQYEGRINRADLMTFFGISAPQASNDLGLYQKRAPANMAYDPRSREYQAQSSFEPVFGRAAANRYLNELQRLARQIIDPDESFIGFIPPTGVVASPARKIEADEVAILVRAIRDRTALRVTYQSMDLPSAITTVISPHAMGFDGLRWHIRAWCHSRDVFRDFAIGRLCVKGEAPEAADIDPASDVGWNTTVVIELVPHPNLTDDQRRAVVRDFGMVDERVLLPCRKAMLFYTLRHLNLESLSLSEYPAQQHVVVENPEEVRRWMQEDRDGEAAPTENTCLPRLTER